MYLNQQEIKIELLKMLRTFVFFCDKNDISYSIMSGTMLGTIRHKGFIPWDDDIDIGILRHEYDKLISILKVNNYIDTYELQSYELGNSRLPFLKMVNRNILVIEEESNLEENLWIDIFPFDQVGQDNSIINKLCITTRHLYHYKRESLGVCQYKRTSKIQTLKKYVSILFNQGLIVRTLLLLCRLSDKIQNNSSIVQDLVWGTKPIPKYLFDELVDYQFENITVKGFKDYDTYLTCIYGDYMKLPPEDQRVNHGIKAWRVNSDEE